jgi:hypothetical protein
LDADEAGKKEAWGFWVDVYGAKRCPPVGAKDPTDMHQAGTYSIREWIQTALDHYGYVRPFPPEWLERYTDDELERLAIMTFDGKLSDEEAKRILNY